MGLIKLAAIRKKPLKDDEAYFKSYTRHIKGKDESNPLDLLYANKKAAKATDKYKQMVRKVRIKNVGKIVRNVGVGGLVTGAAVAYAKKIRDKHNESD